ncbi:MAG TPA: RidA family protein [Armatimonadota bacterium]|jgi:2-iminobutanoate/2-iminopropanoate deaminase|nr:RidA family protein [Armatimonadota bacterium]HOJ21227.1 RidA family protein [Armatimonadota bacterium]HOM82901.1 RidA family protein [Armatimonadota bacterium]HPO73371.1 RidA family protein [Armatimonadota bacterium]
MPMLESIKPHPSIPLAGAVRVGNMLYVSGQVGYLPGTSEIVPGGVAAQTRQALENIRAILEEAGSSLNHVVKTTVILTDVQRDFAVMNQVYAEVFGDHRPARTTLGAALARPGLEVEIECIAVIP